MMERKKLLAALKQLKVETGRLACLGCGYEHNCGVHGCAIIREAVAYIADLEATHRTEMCEDGYDCTELGKVRKALQEAEKRAEKAERERDEYFKHLQGLCFCCAHRTDGFNCHVKCYGHKRGSAWVYAGPRTEE